MSLLQVAAAHAGQGTPYWFLNALTIVKLSGEQTGGTFALLEETLPAGRASPFHLHHNEDESFYVLEGELSFFSGSDKIRATTGSTIFLPREQPHGFRADTAAKILILTTPSGFDAFVAEAGEPATELRLPEPREPDFARLTQTAGKYCIDILGPLPE
ncbi:MAG: cupin domain-containing protein [Planctomycetota bacterium]|nr:MAG: cupin domain-containing protein [Planctomycetota bacterium]